ncbi:MAG: hypothetical protein ACTH2X_10190 [Brachybacterium tyrofermentans]
MSKIITPYDTGQRAEPKPWQRTRRDILDVMLCGDAEDIGNVDFDNDEAATVVTIHVSRDPDGGYTVHVMPFTDAIRLDLHTER